MGRVAGMGEPGPEDMLVLSALKFRAGEPEAARKHLSSVPALVDPAWHAFHDEVKDLVAGKAR
jgi:hypothetical protein